MVETLTKTLSKISVAKQDYYLLTTTHQEGDEGVTSFDLTLTDGVCAWCGSVCTDDLESNAGKVKMTYSEYVGQCHKALTRHNVGSLNFIYEVKTKGADLQFVWKKHLASENIKFQLGSVMLHEKSDQGQVMRHIFDSTIESCSMLEEQITSLTSDNERLASERATALKRLEKCVAAKEEMEAEFYSKFVTVLNDKKVKIRELKEELEDALASGPVAPTVEPTPSKPGSTSGKSDGGSSDSNKDGDQTDSEYNTDDDEQGSSKRMITTGSPGGDGSLLLDDGLQQDDHTITTKRRRRGGLGSAKKQTPCKPILPKVTSIEKSKSSRQSSRGSMRKSSSNASRSSDNIETEDLFDNL